ncbi:MAG: type VI secretion system lipoprotein TssJ [Dyella sp.]|nr:type VI secretion system lipoprotein TssJ [Dyella sp.]
MAWRHAIRWLAIASSCWFLAACGSTSVQKDQAKLRIRIETSDNANGDEQGRAMPIMVRVYELKSAAAFDRADFFTLQNSDKKALGDDILAVDEFVMRPGGEKLVRRKSNADTTAIGVLAGFRELGRSVWRATWKFPEAPDTAWYRALASDRNVNLNIRVGREEVSITEVNGRQ